MALAVGGPPSLGAQPALAALQLGRAFAAFLAKPPGAPLGRPAMPALQVARAAGLDVLLLAHRAFSLPLGDADGGRPAEVGPAGPP